MRCSFAIPRSTKGLRSRGCGARESAGSGDDPGHAGFFLRGARRAVSVLPWIACAVAPPYGRAEVSHSGGDATVTAGDTTRIARGTDRGARGEERGGALGPAQGSATRIHARECTPPRL